MQSPFRNTFSETVLYIETGPIVETMSGWNGPKALLERL
jgi:hypothetical protein